MSSLSPKANIIVRKMPKRHPREISLGLGISDFEPLVPALLLCGLGKELNFVNLRFLLCENASAIGRDKTAHIYRPARKEDLEQIKAEIQCAAPHTTGCRDFPFTHIFLQHVLENLAFLRGPRFNV